MGMTNPGVRLSGAELLESDRAADVKLLYEDLLLQASLAREDVAAFFEFVIREEKTLAPVKLAPHQRVLLEFVQAHDRPVLMGPVGHAKSTSLLGYTLWMLGTHPELRGAIISATQEQAEKFVITARDYIENSLELRLVFPNLRRSQRAGDHWTQTRLVVQRPIGIRDPSLVAIGMDGAIEGARLNWVIVDDLLKADNTRTKEACLKVREWVQTSVESRMDKGQGLRKIVFSNTPWHPDDLVMTLRDAGWPTLTMDVEGFIHVQDDRENARAAREEGRPFEPWDSDLLRPAYPDAGENDRLYNVCRLKQHPDGSTLWPERIDRRELERTRRNMESHAFLQSYMCQVRDNDTAWCKEQWITLGKLLARCEGDAGKEILQYMPAGKPAWDLQKAYRGPYQAHTGVDLAVSERAASDDTAFFTFCVLPTGHRLVLDIEILKCDGPTMARKVAEKHRLFNSIVTVEDVGMQKMVIQLVQKHAKGVPIKGYTTTGSRKASIENGLPIIFAELEQGLWLIPNDQNGVMNPHVRKWVEGLLQYEPGPHTPDALMAMLFARDRARLFGQLTPGGNGGPVDLDFNSR